MRRVWRIGWLLGMLLLPWVAEAASQGLSWTYSPQPQDRRFTLLRCEQRSSGCPMRTLTTLSLTRREYTDTTVKRQRRYCYQIHTETLMSNKVCTP